MFFVVYICSVANEKKRFFELRGEEDGAAWKRKSGLSVFDLLNVFDSPVRVGWRSFLPKKKN